MRKGERRALLRQDQTSFVVRGFRGEREVPESGREGKVRREGVKHRNIRRLGTDSWHRHCHHHHHPAPSRESRTWTASAILSSCCRSTPELDEARRCGFFFSHTSFGMGSVSRHRWMGTWCWREWKRRIGHRDSVLRIFTYLPTSGESRAVGDCHSSPCVQR